MTGKLFDPAGVRFEVAQESLGAIISHHAEQLGLALSKQPPDQANIKMHQQAIRNMTAAREDLDPADVQAMERTIAQYGPMARALTAT